MLHDLTLEGHGTRLVPLADEHAEPLSAYVDDRLWAGMSSPTPDTPSAMRVEIHAAHQAPGRLAFTVLDSATGQVRGSTSFYDWDPRIGRVEIGYTYYDPRWWGTTNNPACKLLMLTHAFEWAVEFVKPVLLPGTVTVRIAGSAEGFTFAGWDARSGKPHLTGSVIPLR